MFYTEAKRVLLSDSWASGAARAPSYESPEAGTPTAPPRRPGGQSDPPRPCAGRRGVRPASVSPGAWPSHRPEAPASRFPWEPGTAGGRWRHGSGDAQAAQGPDTGKGGDGLHPGSRILSLAHVILSGPKSLHSRPGSSQGQIPRPRLHDDASAAHPGLLLLTGHPQLPWGGQAAAHEEEQEGGWLRCLQPSRTCSVLPLSGCGGRGAHPTGFWHQGG